MGQVSATDQWIRRLELCISRTTRSIEVYGAVANLQGMLDAYRLACAMIQQMKCVGRYQVRNTVGYENPGEIAVDIKEMISEGRERLETLEGGDFDQQEGFIEALGYVLEMMEMEVSCLV